MYHPITFHIVFVHLEKFTIVCVRVVLRLNGTTDEHLNMLSDRVLVVAARSSCPVRSLLPNPIQSGCYHPRRSYSAPAF